MSKHAASTALSLYPAWALLPFPTRLGSESLIPLCNRRPCPSNPHPRSRRQSPQLNTPENGNTAQVQRDALPCGSEHPSFPEPPASFEPKIRSAQSLFLMAREYPPKARFPKRRLSSHCRTEQVPWNPAQGSRLVHPGNRATTLPEQNSGLGNANTLKRPTREQQATLSSLKSLPGVQVVSSGRCLAEFLLRALPPCLATVFASKRET